MSIVFHTPGHQAQRDLSGSALAAFQQLWNQNLIGWTGQSVIGNPWSNENDAPRSFYFDPSENDQGWPDSQAVPIQWTPFPNRLLKYYGPGSQPAAGGQLSAPLTQEQVWEAADLGGIQEGDSFYPFFVRRDLEGTVAKLPATKCPNIAWDGDWTDFSPTGPRGWLDEYCEWAITYDGNTRSGDMTSIMFTCENPGYWLSLWQLDPDRVVALYQEFIDPAVTLDDLVLRYPEGYPNAGDPVIDPTTGQPAYDPTNLWNGGPGFAGASQPAVGTMRTPGTSGGAMHLSSPPNTLGAEIYLAAAATIQRSAANSTDPQALICCAEYGQNFRNSDPHIGALGNRVAEKSMYSLTDPVGLYMQTPNFSLWETPAEFKPEDCWNVTRGEIGSGNGTDSILHAVVEIPQEYAGKYTLNDLKINGAPLRWAGQIADTFQIALRVTPKSPDGATNPKLPCVASKPQDTMQPWPVQFVPEPLYQGQSPSALPLRVAPGSTTTAVLIVQGADENTTTETARVEVDGAGVTLKVTDFLKNASGIPGQTDSGGTQGYIVEVTVDADADAGPRSVRALNPSEGSAPSPSEHPYAVGQLEITG